MSAHRFFLPPEACREPVLTLTGAEAHHALDVLRLRRGERLTVLDGAGQELRCEMQEGNRREVRLAVVERHSHSPVPWRITLLQALPKGKIIESIIQKATELGVFRIVPLLSERVVSHVNEKESVRKGAKWQSVAIEALKQCGSPWLPRVEASLQPKQFLGRKEECELQLVGSLQPGSKHPREYFKDFEQQNDRRPKSVSVWVGPEGDFTPAELAMIQSAGVMPITLGPLVLRTETAAVYCLSVLNYELRSP